MTGSIIFDPLIPWPLLLAVAGLALGGVVLALWRGLSGWALRALGAIVVLAALAGPVYQEEDRAALSDIVILLEDQSASQQLGERPAQMAEAIESLETAIAGRANTELRRVQVENGVGDAGTEIMSALADALAEEPRARIAGIIALSDGRAHDLDRARVAELKAAGANILCWTIKSAAQEADARKVAQNVTFEGYLPQHPA